MPEGQVAFSFAQLWSCDHWLRSRYSEGLCVHAAVFQVLSLLTEDSVGMKFLLPPIHFLSRHLIRLSYWINSRVGNEEECARIYTCTQAYYLFSQVPLGEWYYEADGKKILIKDKRTDKIVGKMRSLDDAKMCVQLRNYFSH